MRKSKEELDKILTDKFFEIYPKDILPNWHDKYFHFLHFANKQKNAVQLNVYVQKIFELQSNQSWEYSNGQKILVSIENGEKKVAINYNYSEYMIFSGCLYKDLSIQVVTSINITELRSLKKENFVPKNSTELVWRYA